MIKTFVELQREIENKIEEASKLAKTLEKLRKESMNNGGKNIELITTDLCLVYCRIEQLAITMECNKSLGKNTNDTPTTPVTTIIKSAVYMPKSP